MACLIVVSGVIAVYQEIQDDKNSNKREKTLENILYSSVPTKNQLDMFFPLLSDFGMRNGYLSFGFTCHTGRTALDFKDEKLQNTGYLLLYDSEVMAVLVSQKPDDILEEYFFSKYESANLHDNWNDVTSELLSLISHVATEVGGKGACCNLDYESLTASFRLVGDNEIDLGYSELIFQSKDLDLLCSKTRIDRGRAIIKYFTNIISKGSNPKIPNKAANQTF